MKRASIPAGPRPTVAGDERDAGWAKSPEFGEGVGFRRKIPVLNQSSHMLRSRSECWESLHPTLCTVETPSGHPYLRHIIIYVQRTEAELCVFSLQLIFSPSFLCSLLQFHVSFYTIKSKKPVEMTVTDLPVLPGAGQRQCWPIYKIFLDKTMSFEEVGPGTGW